MSRVERRTREAKVVRCPWCGGLIWVPLRYPCPLPKCPVQLGLFGGDQCGVGGWQIATAGDAQHGTREGEVP